MLLDDLIAVQAGLRQAGKRLAEYENDPEIGTGGAMALLVRATEVTGIPQATVRAWWRVAKGELPGEIMQTKIRHSVIESMTTELARSIVGGKKCTIVSPTEGRLLSKAVKDFDRRESAIYVRSTAVLGVDKVHGDAPYRRLRASAAEWDDDKKTLQVTVDSERIHILIPRSVMQVVSEAAVA